MAKIKVSQKTIDKIKAMGMTAALKKAPNASPEMKEALTRMYGAKRVAAAGGKSKPVAKSADAARSSSTKVSTKSVYKSADAARASASKVSTAKSTTKKANTTSNPFTALHNVVSPYGNKNQKYVSGLPKEGLAGRKSVPGKPSVGEQISGLFSGKAPAGLRANNGMTAAQVAAENKRRAAAVAAAKAKKNK